MKKILVFLVLASMLLGVSGVMALDQAVTLDVSPVVNVAISPDIINFSSGNPGDIQVTTPLSFNLDSSNTNVTVKITGVTGNAFNNGNLAFDEQYNLNSVVYNFICTINADACTFNVITSQPKLWIHPGFRAGDYTGTVTFSANEGVQNITKNLAINVKQVINVAVSPASVDFGAVTPGTTATASNIVFNASNSNADLVVVYTSVSGAPFNGNLKLDNLDAGSQIISMPCLQTGEVCNYDIKQVVPTLSVPIGFVAGTKTGTITYTITGSNPPQ